MRGLLLADSNRMSYGGLPSVDLSALCVNDLYA
jgi:hypothetical protein